jgi:hypothetical protein
MRLELPDPEDDLLKRLFLDGLDEAIGVIPDGEELEGICERVRIETGGHFEAVAR